jgi:hypothetical protein
MPLILSLISVIQNTRELHCQTAFLNGLESVTPWVSLLQGHYFDFIDGLFQASLLGNLRFAAPTTPPTTSTVQKADKVGTPLLVTQVSDLTAA